MKRRKFLSDRKRLEKHLDKLWSQRVLERDQFCQKCGKHQIQPHHIFTKTRYNTRWDIENGIALCNYHHIWWAHKEPYEFADWMKKRKGVEWWEVLEMRSKMSGEGKDLVVLKMCLERGE